MRQLPRWSPVGLGLALLTAFFVLGPLAYLFWMGVGQWGAGFLGRATDLSLAKVILQVLLLATLTTAWAIVLGVPLAWLAVRSDLPWRQLFRWLAPLPLAVPPYIGAIVYQILLAPGGLVPEFLGFSALPISFYSLWGAAAILGLCANLASSRVLARAPSLSLNIRGARLNVVADALGSCGVIAAGILIRWKDWRLADPLASIFIGLLIALSSWGLVKQSVNVLLEASPAHLDTGQIVEAMRGVAGVREVHDLHVWTITTGLEAMSGHILVDDLGEGPKMLDALNRVLSEQFGITHTTFQMELYRQNA